MLYCQANECALLILFVLQHTELKTKALRGVLYNFLGVLGKSLSAFIVSIFLSRLLTPQAFGLVGIVTTFIAFGQGLADLGLSSGLIKAKDPSHAALCSVFFFNLGVGVLLALGLFGAAGLIAQFYDTPQLGPLVRASAPLFVLNSLNTVQQAQFYARLEVRPIQTSALASVVLSGVGGVGLAWLGFEVWSLVFSAYLASLVSIGFMWYYSSWRPSFTFAVAELRPLLPFGFRVFIVNYLDTVFAKLDVFFIGKFSSAATLGYYTRAASFNQLVTRYTSQGLSGIFFPTINHLRHDPAQVKAVYMKAVDVICFLSFGLAGGLYLVAEPLIVFLFSAKWLPSVGFFKIMAISSYVFPLSLIFNGVLLGTGRSALQLRLDILKKSLLLAALPLLVFLNVATYLAAYAGLAIVGAGLSLYKIGKIIQLSYFQHFILVHKYGVCAALALGATWLGTHRATWGHPSIQVAGLGLIFVLLYGGLNWAFRFAGLPLAWQVVGRWLPWLAREKEHGR